MAFAFNVCRIYFYIVDFGGAFNAPKTIVQTPIIPIPPTAYAMSLPAHQYNVQNANGPRDLPIWPGST